MHRARRGPGIENQALENQTSNLPNYLRCSYIVSQASNHTSILPRFIYPKESRASLGRCRPCCTNTTHLPRCRRTGGNSRTLGLARDMQHIKFGLPVTPPAPTLLGVGAHPSQPQALAQSRVQTPGTYRAGDRLQHRTPTINNNDKPQKSRQEHTGIHEIWGALL